MSYSAKRIVATKILKQKGLSKLLLDERHAHQDRYKKPKSVCCKEPPIRCYRIREYKDYSVTCVIREHYNFGKCAMPNFIDMIHEHV